MVISSPAGHGRRTNKNSAESLSGTSAFRIPYFFLRSIVERFHIRRRFPPPVFVFCDKSSTLRQASTRTAYYLKTFFHLPSVSTETKRAEETVVTSVSRTIVHS